ncbi:MAG TPA: hypothetical protein VNK49_13780 [Anaerolineales bacterium]|nr:hypothetical protein [Anaerolineales bacterium]
MGRNLGLWIDHKQAYVIDEGAKEPVVIKSNVEPLTKHSGGTRAGGKFNLDSELRDYDRFQHHLREYYHQVIAAIRDADRILVFGPGEAKIELEREIRKSKPLAKKLVGVETAGKMTKNQMMAHVRKFYSTKHRAV